MKPAIILVKSQLAENIGMAARAMKNCGLEELRLVAPVQRPHYQKPPSEPPPTPKKYCIMPKSIPTQNQPSPI